MNWGKWNHFTTETAIAAFMEKVEVDPVSGCHIWKGAIGSHKRYGIVGVAGKQWLAHRAAWFLFKGENPKHNNVCHKCDNGFCVNPDHLFLGTQKDNVLDMENKKRSNHPSGENHGRAKLNWSEVQDIRRLHKYGMSIRGIARVYPQVNRVTVAAIIKNKTWIESPDHPA